MKILQVNKFNFLKGGAAKYFLDLSRLLRSSGIEVAKFSMAHPENEADQKWEKYFTPFVDFNASAGLVANLKAAGRILWNPSANKKFEKIIADFQPDIIHIHNIYHQISPSILHVAKRKKIPIVMHLHDYKMICPNYKLFTQNRICHKCKGHKYYNCVRRKCVKQSYAKSALAMLEAYLHNLLLKSYDKVDLFIAPSQFMKDTCVAFGIPENKIKVIYNFTDIKKEDCPEKEKADDSSYLLYFGRLSEEKGIDTIIKAMPRIKGELSLKIVGTGPEKKSLEKLIDQLGLQKRVQLTGSKYKDDLKKIILGAKTVIIPSVWNENMPLSLLEALALKKVVIASRVGGIPEIIRHEKNGFLFDPGNIKELSALVNQIDEYDLESIRENAYSSVQKLNPTDHLQEILKIYNKLILEQRSLDK